MTRYAVPALIGALIVVGLAIVAVLLGTGLLPTQAQAVEKGTYAPWVIVWGMIAIVCACALGLAIFLFSEGFKGLSSERSRG